MASLLDLPNEILHQIVVGGAQSTHQGPSLGELTLSNLALSCRRLCEVANPALWTYASQEAQSRVMTFAAHHGNVSILRKSLIYNFDINNDCEKPWSAGVRDDPVQMTVFGRAVCRGQDEAVSWFLDNGIEVDTPAYTPRSRMLNLQDGRAALSLALRARQTSTAMLLLDRGASPTNVTASFCVKDDYFWVETSEMNALQTAVREGLPEVCERLIREYELDPLDDYYGFDALTLAAWGVDHPETIIKLIELGSPVERPSLSDWQRTPLCVALKEKNLSNATALIERGASIISMAEDTWKPYPMQECMQKYGILGQDAHEERLKTESRRIQFLAMLLQKGVDINNKNDECSGTPLRKAVLVEDLSSVEFLLKFGADINLASGEIGTTAMTEAVKNHIDAPTTYTTNIIKTLLNYGARIDYPDEIGMTVLEYAVDCEHCADADDVESSCQLLLANSTRQNVTQEHIDEVLDLKFHENCYYSSRALFEFGARLSPEHDKSNLHRFARRILLDQGAGREFPPSDVEQAFKFVAQQKLRPQDLNNLLLLVLIHEDWTKVQMVLNEGALRHPDDGPLLPIMMLFALECKEMDVFRRIWRIVIETMATPLTESLLPSFLRKAVKRGHRNAAFFFMNEGADPLRLFTPPSAMVDIALRNQITAELATYQKDLDGNKSGLTQMAEKLLCLDESSDYSALELACSNSNEDIVGDILQHFYRRGMKLPRILDVPCNLANSQKMVDLFKMKGLI